MIDTPLQLRPRLVPKPWGGRRLAAFGRDLPDGVLVGESWEVADLDPATTPVPDPVTRVAAGPHAGASLGELAAAHHTDLLGGAPPPDGRFPLLVKLLDAREALSVQVHPPATYAAGHPDVAVKTETWVVVDADPGAELLLGVADGVTPDQLADAAGTGRVVPLLRRRPARPGDVHHVPAGTVHTLGGGVVVAEVQTPSDTTFRLYDWTDELGRAPRELDLPAALASIAAAWDDNVEPPPPQPAAEPAVVDTPHYRLRRETLSAGTTWTSPGGVARVLLVLDGALAGGGAARPLGRGGCVVLPACLPATFVADTACSVVEVALPADPPGG